MEGAFQHARRLEGREKEGRIAAGQNPDEQCQHDQRTQQPPRLAAEEGQRRPGQVVKKGKEKGCEAYRQDHGDAAQQQGLAQKLPDQMTAEGSEDFA